jgi:hypothetical protein
LFEIVVFCRGSKQPPPDVLRAAAFRIYVSFLFLYYKSLSIAIFGGRLRLGISFLRDV